MSSMTTPKRPDSTAPADAFDPDSTLAFQRRMERALIGEYRASIEEILKTLDAGNRALAVEIARIPEEIRGYGHVKARHLAAARGKWATLMAAWRAGAFQLSCFASSWWWLHISLHQFGGLASGLAVIAVGLLALGMSLYLVATAALWARWQTGRPGLDALGFAGAWLLAEWLRANHGLKVRYLPPDVMMDALRGSPAPPERQKRRRPPVASNRS